MTKRTHKKDQFCIPEGMIYLDGNSLGPLAKTVETHVQHAISDEWGQMLIKAWNAAEWIDLPSKLGNQIAPLIGAPKDTIIVGDTLSIQLHQALSAALHMNPERRFILTDNGNFPSDIYVAKALAAKGSGHEVKLVAPEAVEAMLASDIAVLMLTHVDYRTSRMHDLHALTKAAQAHGIIVIWDLAHSTGALPVEIEASGAEFAIGCSYKYLNGGPGAPAFLYAREDIISSAAPALNAWLGHENPFAFSLDFTPAPSIDRFRIGTPAILQMRALEAALALWEDVDINDIRARSFALSERFRIGIETQCPALRLVSPKDPKARGAHLSFAFENAYALVQALIAQGVIGDFRAPNLARFGFTPLYLDEDDIDQALAIIVETITNETWRAPEFQSRNKVT